MKKTVLFLLVLLTSKCIQAQLSYGAKAGLNYSVISVNVKQGSSEDIENPSGVGFHLGGYANYSLSEKLSLRPELLFNSCKTKDKSETTSSTKSFDDNLNEITITTRDEEEDKSSFNYILIPLLADYSVSNNISLQVGPSVGLLMGYKNEYTSVSTITYSNGEPSDTENFAGTSTNKTGINTMHLGISLGGIYQLDNGVNLGVRYDRGISSINSLFKEFVTEKWNTIQISVGYQFVK